MTAIHQAQQSSPHSVFNRALVRQHRDRAAAQFHNHSHLFDEVGDMVAERLQDIKRDFPAILNLGAHRGVLQDYVVKRTTQAGGQVTATNLSPAFLTDITGATTFVVDEEFLPFTSPTFDLVVSSMALHWVNDLPGALVQIRQAMRPDGAFVGALLGGATLHELRSCLAEAEMEVTGGLSPRLSPTIDLLTMSHLMQRAGFSLPVVDSEIVTVLYPDLMTLLHDLRDMGETNANLQRIKHTTRRSVFTEAERLYRTRYADDAGALIASFEVLFVHGWGVSAQNLTGC